MARDIVEVLKSGVNAALEETVEELWGEDAVAEIQPDTPEEELRKEIIQMAALLKTVLGVRMASQLCGAYVSKEFSGWVRGEALPNTWQLRCLRQAYEISALLKMRLTTEYVKFWWYNRNDYLAGYTPFNLFNSDPNGVRMAALSFLMETP